MTPIELNIDFILVRDGQAKRVKALGIVPEGIYYQTDRTALVSGRLIKEFAHWEELELAMPKVENLEKKIWISLIMMHGYSEAYAVAINTAKAWLARELNGDNIEGCKDADALEKTLVDTIADELNKKIQGMKLIVYWMP